MWCRSGLARAVLAEARSCRYTKFVQWGKTVPKAQDRAGWDVKMKRAGQPRSASTARPRNKAAVHRNPKLCLLTDDRASAAGGRVRGRGLLPPPIGGRLREVRLRRNLTLGDVGRLCGISKSMLSQIERGKVNPTFATLWHLTRSLGVGIGELLGEVQSQAGAVRSYEHVRVLSHPTITTADGLCTTRILSPRGYALPLEWYEIIYKPGGALRANAHGNGEWEHMTVISGRVVVELDGKEVVLEAGESIRYSGDQPHGARNGHGGESRVMLVVVPLKALNERRIPHGPLDEDA